MNTTRLRAFFYGLSELERENFATRSGTTVGMVKQVIHGNRNCNPALAINFERESQGAVVCNELCPDVDFNFLRKTSVNKDLQTAVIDCLHSLKESSEKLNKLAV